MSKRIRLDLSNENDRKTAQEWLEESDEDFIDNEDISDTSELEDNLEVEDYPDSCQEVRCSFSNFLHTKPNSLFSV